MPTPQVVRARAQALRSVAQGFREDAQQACDHSAELHLSVEQVYAETLRILAAHENALHPGPTR